MNALHSNTTCTLSLSTMLLGASVVFATSTKACDDVISDPVILPSLVASGQVQLIADTADGARPRSAVMLAGMQDNPVGLRVLSIEDTDDPAGNDPFFGGQFEARLSRIDDGRKIEVTIRDGNVSARLDGKDVPIDSIIHDGDRVVILDNDGEEIETFWLGQDRALRWRAPNDQDAEPPRVMMGIHLGTPGPALERHLGLEPGTTTMIEALYEGLPAHDAGLGEFDIITAIDGRAPAGPADLRAALDDKDAGDTLQLSIIHEGKKRTVTVHLDAFDREAMSSAKLIGRANQQMHGLRFFGKDGQMPGAIMEDLDIHVPGLDNVFIDPDQRVFEKLPDNLRDMLDGVGASPWFDLRSDRKEQSDDRDAIEDRDLREIDDRLKALERMLEEVLNDRRRQRP